MANVLIIAEAGVNHNGDISIAKKLIDVAVDAGADYVKFQTFKTEKLVSKNAKKAAYQIRNDNSDENQFQMLKKLELTLDDHYTLIKYCKSKGIKFLSTAFDLESIDLLNELEIDLFKIPSGEITNLPYLSKIGRLRKKIILSTGMSNVQEIKDALTILNQSGTLNKDITILHCNTEYPTPIEDVNLNAMLSIKKLFDVNIGYSDHTLGSEIPVAAVALGATVIEKHFTLDKNMIGPDHHASMEPKDLKEMISMIRNIEKAMGDGIKKASQSEEKNKVAARKSICYASNQKKGHILILSDFEMKRPGNGISPMRLYDLIGKQLNHDVSKDEIVRWEDFI